MTKEKCVRILNTMFYPDDIIPGVCYVGKGAGTDGSNWSISNLSEFDSFYRTYDE